MRYASWESDEGGRRNYGVKPGEYVNQNGKIIGDDENGRKDDKIHLVTNKEDIKTIKTNNKEGNSTNTNDVSIDVTTSVTELTAATNVLDRAKSTNEECAVVTPEGDVVNGESGQGVDETGVTSSELPSVPGNDNTSIHNHPVEETKTGYFDALVLGPNDKNVFKNYKSNIIVGAFGKWKTDNYGEPFKRTQGAAFYNRQSKYLGKLSRQAINLIKANTKSN
jgi:hypothetical protein